MASAITVANRLRELSGGTLTPLQLIKLTYISHGWSHAINNKPLFDDRIEAWQYGPVVPKLYHAVKDYRAEPVAGPIPEWGEPLTAEEDALVTAVFNTYGKLSGGQLSAMTHMSGTPWDIAWRRGRNSQITDDMVADHYRKLAAERRARA